MLGAVLLAACFRGPGSVHVRSISLGGGLSPPLREAGLDESAVAAATRDGLRAAGLELGDGARPHDARVSISVRYLRGGVSSGRGPRVEVTVEIALAPADRSTSPRREQATASVGLTSAASPREAWLSALADAARSASQRHALALAAEGKPMQKLIADLAAPDPRVRENAIRILGERRSREAVPALIGRLGSEEPRVVQRVAAALAQIGDERAVPALIDLSRSDDPALAGRLVRYIGDIGGAEAEAYLLTLASGHPDRRIRKAAREALDDMEARAKEASVASRK